MSSNDTKPGLIALLGSGETLPSSRRTHEEIIRYLPKPPNIAILETPAGFEPNSDRVAGKIKEFLVQRLQNYSPNIDILPARKKGTLFSPDDPEIVAPLFEAHEILLGPGSPTYAAAQLKDSLAYEIMKAKHQLGTALFLSSAATLAFSKFTMPVYEIYKVGEDLHWKNGLNFFANYGLSLSIIPHWNNNDGGEELDTSRCYLGRARFEQLADMLPKGNTIIGIDEHTSLIIDLSKQTCKIIGKGIVTILRNGDQKNFTSEQQFDLTQLGKARIPKPGKGVDPKIWEQTLIKQKESIEQSSKTRSAPDEVLTLVEKREEARNNRDWKTADRLRKLITDVGWQVMDTPDGSKIIEITD
jgi:hypothetical protein